MNPKSIFCRLGFLVAFSIGSTGLPRVAIAQETAPDSIAAKLAELQRRLDSLEAVIRELQAGNADTRAPELDLAALRAAAAAAASQAREDAPPPEEQGSRTRNLSMLNPEISVTGDFVGNFIAPEGGGRTLSATPREFEFSFQAALDPYTRAKVFVSREEEFEIAGMPEPAGAEPGGGGGFEIEEGYMYWVGLPGGLGAKVGKFRQEIGLFNRWHTHALFEIERPLAAATFLGDDGLIQAGVSVALPSVTIGPATEVLTVEATRGDNDALFDGGGQMSFLGRLLNFWDISPSTYLQLGVTGVVGRNDEEDMDTRLLGVDLSFRWKPGAQATYRDLTLKAEWYFARRETPLLESVGDGGYLQANYRLDQRWILGARADFLNPYGADPDIVQLVPSITWWQSEWVRIRLQYNHLRSETGEANHTALLQFVWAMGPHKHETY